MVSRRVQLGQGVIHPAAAAFWPFKSRPKRKAKAQKNVLVLMSNTGGGHKASAQAIEAGFKELYGDKYVLFPRAVPICSI